MFYRVSGALLTAVLGVGLVASPASADTATAKANGLALTLLNNPSPTLTSGTRLAKNDGATTTYSGPSSGGLGLLNGQSVLAAGVIVQQAYAFNNGSSVACAGVVGSGGLIQLGDSGNCVVKDAPKGGVVINLQGILTIKADALMEQAQSSSNGTATAQGTFVNATIQLLGGSVMPIGLHPAVGDKIDLTPLIAIFLNTQTKGSDGSISADLIKIKLIGDPAVGATVASVAAGPNASTGNIPVVPLAGIPLSVLIVGLVAYRGWWVPRRRRMAASAA
jgi:hypothetical protein